MMIDLEIEGEEVPLNNFVKRVLVNVLEGIIGELHGVDEDWDELKIEIRK